MEEENIQFNVKALEVKCLCPECKKEIPHVIIDRNGKQKNRKIVYPVWENGKFNWKNAFHVDPVVLMLVIAIIAILFGCYQINQSCYDIIEEHNKNVTEVSQYALPISNDAAVYPNTVQPKAIPN